MDKSFFKKVESKTGMNIDDIMNLADALAHANFSDEKQVRKIVKKVSKIANKTITSDMEEKIVQSIVKDGHTLDFSKIERLMR